MSTSSKLSRQPPERKFEDYVLTYAVDEGLFPVQSSAMESVTGLSTVSTSANYSDGSAVLDIGFTFKFDGIEYTQVFVSTHGWLFLVDPASTAHAATDVVSTAFNNTTIKSSFTKKHMLLSPWFDELRNTASDIEDIESNAATCSLIKHGFLDYPSYCDTSICGVRFHRGNSSLGKMFCVRWKSFSTRQVTYAKSRLNTITFECVIYENGTIEFRYDGLHSLKDLSFGTIYVETATVGIFAHGGTLSFPRYRDFAPLLRTADTRQLHQFGGAAYNGTYLSVGSVKYACTLSVIENWPARFTSGAVMKFSPPKLKKRSMKKDFAVADAKQFIGGSQLFNDNKSFVHSQQLLDYPSRMPKNSATRFSESSLHQSLISSSSIEILSELNPNFFENITEEKAQKCDPFSETNLFEQGNMSDPFFSTGSDVSVGESGKFSSSLSNKVQIRMSFPVKNKIQMLGNSSSLYYLDTGKQQWNIPTKSIPDHVGPFEKISFNASSIDGTSGNGFSTDVIGFDQFGNSLVSGNLDILRKVTVGYSTPFDGHGDVFRSADTVDYLIRDFQKSVQRNQDYNATDSETFTLPIEQPFLIEKVVIEVPFCFGNGWFYDKTLVLPITASGDDFKTDTNPLNFSYIFDEGGPAITLSLMSQVPYGTSSIRDLITCETFTHNHDIDSSIVLRNISGSVDTSSMKLFAVVNGMPKNKIFDTSVSASFVGSNRFFSGSVVVKSDVSITNGVKVKKIKQIVGTKDEKKTQFTTMLDSEYVTAESVSTLTIGINTFGRGMTGFAPSGCSIFGGEYVTSQDLPIIAGQQSLKNDFYTFSPTARSKVIGELTASLDIDPYEIHMMTYDMIGSKKKSPYLVYPNQKLILAASKTRPTHEHYSINVTDIDTGKGTLLSSSYFNPLPPGGHDVQFNTGSVNMTFYGSYVRANSEYTP